MSDIQNKPPVESKRTRLIPELRATLKQINLTSEVSRGKSAEFSTDTILQSETLTREFLSNIAIIAFVGQSGTGKSTRAIAVARQNNIDYLKRRQDRCRNVCQEGSEQDGVRKAGAFC